jgi:hypothetical protein
MLKLLWSKLLIKPRKKILSKRRKVNTPQARKLILRPNLHLEQAYS